MIPIIMAIWYGMRAHRFGRQWFGWAILGFFVPWVTAQVAVYAWAYALGFLYGVFTGGTRELEGEALETVVLISVFGALATAILVGLVAGFKVLRPLPQRRPEAGIGFVDCPACGVRNLVAASTCTLCGARLGKYTPSLQETAVTGSSPQRHDSADQGE